MSDRDNDQLDDEEAADFEFIGRVDLDDEGQYQADVYRNADADPEEEFHLQIEDIADLLGVDVNDQEFLLDMLTQAAPDVGQLGFDMSSPNGRGGYDRDEVIRFLRETGWWGLVDIYYDQTLDEYFIELPDDTSGFSHP